MKKLFLFILAITQFIACNNEGDEISPALQNETPLVQSTPKYNVILEEDVTYAEGLSHESLNSTSTTTIPLKLDVYIPDNNLENRPAFIFIHGGGFVGGSKKQSKIVDFANYYTSRGWVFISIDYRLRDDNGTVPQLWADHAVNILNDQIPQFLAIYPAQRDAKAALRWVIANADRYKINTDYLTVGGGSAGAITAITTGVSEQEDFRDEINGNQDPTLMNTNLDQSYQIRTIVDLWGSKIALDLLQEIYGHERFDNNDPPLFIVHGTEDPTVPFSRAEDLKSMYEANGVPFVFYPLEGLGHGAWNATVNGKRIEELAFDFIIEQQNLVAE